MTIVRWMVVAAGAVLLAGCSSRSVPAGDVATAPTSLLEANELLHAAVGPGGRPPARLADLDRHKAIFPRGYEAIKTGEIVVVWGGKPKGEGEVGKGEAVLAYEKAAPTDGGYVVLSAGTIKKMTAAEFNAAPKAGKN